MAHPIETMHALYAKTASYLVEAAEVATGTDIPTQAVELNGSTSPSAAMGITVRACPEIGIELCIEDMVMIAAQCDNHYDGQVRAAARLFHNNAHWMMHEPLEHVATVTKTPREWQLVLKALEMQPGDEADDNIRWRVMLSRRIHVGLHMASKLSQFKVTL